MRKYFAVMVTGAVIVSGFVPTPAAAQAPSRGEVYGGFLWTTGLTSGISSVDIFGAVGEGTAYVNDSLRVLVGGWRPYSNNAFVMFVGGAVDIRASERISVRVQPDLMVWPDDGVVELGFRLSTGVVIGF